MLSKMRRKPGFDARAPLDRHLATSGASLPKVADADALIMYRYDTLEAFATISTCRTSRCASWRPATAPSAARCDQLTRYFDEASVTVGA